MWHEECAFIKPGIRVLDTKQTASRWRNCTHKRDGKLFRKSSIRVYADDTLLYFPIVPHRFLSQRARVVKKTWSNDLSLSIPPRAKLTHTPAVIPFAVIPFCCQQFTLSCLKYFAAHRNVHHLSSRLYSEEFKQAPATGHAVLPAVQRRRRSHVAVELFGLAGTMAASVWLCGLLHDSLAFQRAGWDFIGVFISFLERIGYTLTSSLTSSSSLHNYPDLSYA